MVCLFLISNQTKSQYKEIGLEIGTSHYFGDLNPYSSFAYVRPAASVFYRFNFSPYFAVKSIFGASQLGFDDNLSLNPYNNYRRLNFLANVVEGSSVLEFNFIKFKTDGGKNNRFTPYIFAGIGVMYFQNYVKYNGKWLPIRKLRTELIEYNPYQMMIPFGGGLKYAAKRGFTVAFSITYHHLYSDYLDDVSSVYYGANLLGASINSIADPSSSVKRLSDIADKQRGDQYKDSYLFTTINLSYTINKKNCPSAGKLKGF